MSIEDFNSNIEEMLSEYENRRLLKTGNSTVSINDIDTGWSSGEPWWWGVGGKMADNKLTIGQEQAVLSKEMKQKIDAMSNMVVELMRIDSTMETLRYLDNHRSGLTIVSVLDGCKHVQNLLTEGLLERKVDRGTHYYVITELGQTALKFESV